MKNLLFTICVLLFASCNPCKRLQRICPPVIRDSIIYTETVRDSIIKIKLPGDTTYIEIPALTLEDLGFEVENEDQEITAVVERGVFKLKAICKEDSLEIVVRNLKERLSVKVTTIKVPEPYPEKYIPRFYKWCMWILIVLVLLAGVYIYARIKGVTIKKVFS